MALTLSTIFVNFIKIFYFKEANMLPWLVLNWDPSHIIFLGVFYSAIGTLGLTFTFVVVKSILDYMKGGGH